MGTSRGVQVLFQHHPSTSLPMYSTHQCRWEVSSNYYTHFKIGCLPLVQPYTSHSMLLILLKMCCFWLELANILAHIKTLSYIYFTLQSNDFYTLLNYLSTFFGMVFKLSAIDFFIHLDLLLNNMDKSDTFSLLFRKSYYLKLQFTIQLTDIFQITLLKWKVDWPINYR